MAKFLQLQNVQICKKILAHSMLWGANKKLNKSTN